MKSPEIIAYVRAWINRQSYLHSYPGYQRFSSSIDISNQILGQLKLQSLTAENKHVTWSKFGEPWPLNWIVLRLSSHFLQGDLFLTSWWRYLGFSGKMHHLASKKFYFFGLFSSKLLYTLFTTKNYHWCFINPNESLYLHYLFGTSFYIITQHKRE